MARAEALETAKTPTSEALRALAEIQRENLQSRAATQIAWGAIGEGLLGIPVLVGGIITVNPVGIAAGVVLAGGTAMLLYTGIKNYINAGRRS